MSEHEISSITKEEYAYVITLSDGTCWVQRACPRTGVDYPMSDYEVLLLAMIRERDRLAADLREANKLLRSCYSVAERDGTDTNWPGLLKALRELLNRHHELRLWYEEANSEAYSSAQEIADLRDELERRRWVSVDDRLPKPTVQAGGKKIVPVIMSVNGFVGEGLYCENCKHQWTLDGVEVNPTHWMPLPTAPDKNTSAAECEEQYRKQIAELIDGHGKATEALVDRIAELEARVRDMEAEKACFDEGAEYVEHELICWRRRAEAAEAQVERLREALEVIRDFPIGGRGRQTEDGYPLEVSYDEFAYRRLVDSYREAARAALAQEEAHDA